MILDSSACLRSRSCFFFRMLSTNTSRPGSVRIGPRKRTIHAQTSRVTALGCTTTKEKWSVSSDEIDIVPKNCRSDFLSIRTAPW